MNCEQMNELMSAWLDGELSPRQEEEIRAHLDCCPGCRGVFEQLQGLHTSFSELEEPAPEGFARRVMERVAQESGPKIVPLRRRRAWRGVGALAACALLVVGLGVSRTAFSGGSSEPMAAAVPETAMDARAEEDCFSFARTEGEYALPDAPAAAAPEAPAPAPSPDSAPAETENTTNVAEKQESEPRVWEICLAELPEGLEEEFGTLLWQERKGDRAACVRLTPEQGERLLEMTEEQGLWAECSPLEELEGDGWLLVCLPE